MADEKKFEIKIVQTAVGTNSQVYFTRMTTSKTNHTVAGIEEGRTYYFSVSAVDGAGMESDLSNEARYAVPVYEIQPRVTLQ